MRERLERRVAELTRYQNRAYAAQYEAFVEQVAAREPALAEPVARYLYKVMAYKDEYEVARLLTKPEFARQLATTWEDVESIGFHLHPPLLRSLGLKKKIHFGQWFRVPLRWMASLKFLRGTPLDIFGYAEVRREERGLIGWYRGLMLRLLDRVTPANLPLAIEIASLPDAIRGYESVKMANIEKVKSLTREKLAQLERETVATRS